MKITCALRKERKEAEISRRSTEKMRAEAGFKSHVKATRSSHRERGAWLFIRSVFVTNRDMKGRNGIYLMPCSTMIHRHVYNDKRHVKSPVPPHKTSRERDKSEEEVSRKRFCEDGKVGKTTLAR